MATRSGADTSSRFHPWSTPEHVFQVADRCGGQPNASAPYRGRRLWIRAERLQLLDQDWEASSLS